MSVCVVRAFITMRERLQASTTSVLGVERGTAAGKWRALLVLSARACSRFMSRRSRRFGKRLSHAPGPADAGTTAAAGASSGTESARNRAHSKNALLFVLLSRNFLFSRKETLNAQRSTLNSHRVVVSHSLSVERLVAASPRQVFV
jgi:hypothetical protein